jgi:hypothetical protein
MEIRNLCLTGLKSIDNTEWICGTCHSNLKAGELPNCAKANKMTFLEKPDVLKDLTPLTEKITMYILSIIYKKMFIYQN